MAATPCGNVKAANSGYLSVPTSSAAYSLLRRESPLLHYSLVAHGVLPLWSPTLSNSTDARLTRDAIEHHNALVALTTTTATATTTSSSSSSSSTSSPPKFSSPASPPSAPPPSRVSSHSITSVTAAAGRPSPSPPSSPGAPPPPSSSTCVWLVSSISSWLLLLFLLALVLFRGARTLLCQLSADEGPDPATSAFFLCMALYLPFAAYYVTSRGIVAKTIASLFSLSQVTARGDAQQLAALLRRDRLFIRSQTRKNCLLALVFVLPPYLMWNVPRLVHVVQSPDEMNTDDFSMPCDPGLYDTFGVLLPLALIASETMMTLVLLTTWVMLALVFRAKGRRGRKIQASLTSAAYADRILDNAPEEMARARPELARLRDSRRMWLSILQQEQREGLHQTNTDISRFTVISFTSLIVAMSAYPLAVIVDMLLVDFHRDLKSNHFLYPCASLVAGVIMLSVVYKSLRRERRLYAYCNRHFGTRRELHRGLSEIIEDQAELSESEVSDHESEVAGPDRQLTFDFSSDEEECAPDSLDLARRAAQTQHRAMQRGASAKYLAPTFVLDEVGARRADEDRIIFGERSLNSSDAKREYYYDSDGESGEAESTSSRPRRHRIRRRYDYGLQHVRWVFKLVAKHATLGFFIMTLQLAVHTAFFPRCGSVSTEIFRGVKVAADDCSQVRTIIFDVSVSVIVSLFVTMMPFVLIVILGWKRVKTSPPMVRFLRLSAGCYVGSVVLTYALMQWRNRRDNLYAMILMIFVQLFNIRRAWDEHTELSKARVIQESVQHDPDAVVGVDIELSSLDQPSKSTQAFIPDTPSKSSASTQSTRKRDFPRSMQLTFLVLIVLGYMYQTIIVPLYSSSETDGRRIILGIVVHPVLLFGSMRLIAKQWSHFEGYLRAAFIPWLLLRAAFSIAGRLFLSGIQDISQLVTAVLVFGCLEISVRSSTHLRSWMSWFVLSGFDADNAWRHSEKIRRHHFHSHRIYVIMVLEYASIVYAGVFPPLLRTYYEPDEPNVPVNDVIISVAVQLFAELLVDAVCVFVELNLLDRRYLLVFKANERHYLDGVCYATLAGSIFFMPGMLAIALG